MNQIQVSFGEAIKRAFTGNYCKFTGRASRSEYWWFALFSFIVSFLINVVATPGTVANNVATVIVGLVTLLPSLGLTWRRLHDTGRSGWAYVITAIAACVICGIGCGAMFAGSIVIGTAIIFAALIPVVFLIVWLCQPSQPAANEYGPVPNVG